MHYSIEIMKSLKHIIVAASLIYPLSFLSFAHYRRPPAINSWPSVSHRFKKHSEIKLPRLIPAGSFDTTKPNIVVSTKQPDKPKQTLEELLNGFILTDTGIKLHPHAIAKDIQLMINNKITYIAERDYVFPQLKNTPQAFIPLEEILRKEKGNCNEFFVLMANFLHQANYNVKGIAVYPDNGKPGHIVCVYQDKKTKLYGTAGKTGDFNLPVYKDLETIALHQALKLGTTKAKVEIIECENQIKDSKLVRGDSPVAIKPVKIFDVDLEKKYGLFFANHEGDKGNLDFKMDDEGYDVSYTGLIIPKLDGKYKDTIIKEIRIFYNLKENMYCINVHIKKDDRVDYYLHAVINQKPYEFKYGVYSSNTHDRTKVTNSHIHSYEKDKKVMDYLINLCKAFTQNASLTFQERIKSRKSEKLNKSSNVNELDRLYK